MSKYIINILFLLLPFSAFAQMDDMEEEKDTKPKVVDTVKQLRFGIDISKPIMYSFSGERRSYEAEIDYYLRKDIYAVVEGGFGGAKVNYTDPNHLADLIYTSNNVFFKTGVSKGMLLRLGTNDWDMAFIGARYAFSPIRRSAATYTITDVFWGQTSGSIPAKNLTAHWFELVGGTKVELFKGIFVGWTIRGKFRLNQKTFKELPPAYIAGYGKGDKNSVFDFNFYVNYAIRW
jgi:hypothetical protein